MCIDCGPDCRPGEHQRQRPADSVLPPAAVDHHLHIQGPEVSAELRRRAALAPEDFANDAILQVEEARRVVQELGLRIG